MARTRLKLIEVIEAKFLITQNYLHSGFTERISLDEAQIKKGGAHAKHCGTAFTFDFEKKRLKANREVIGWGNRRA